MIDTKPLQRLHQSGLTTPSVKEIHGRGPAQTGVKILKLAGVPVILDPNRLPASGVGTFNLILGNAARDLQIMAIRSEAGVITTVAGGKIGSLAFDITAKAADNEVKLLKIQAATRAGDKSLTFTYEVGDNAVGSVVYSDKSRTFRLLHGDQGFVSQIAKTGVMSAVPASPVIDTANRLLQLTQSGTQTDLNGLIHALYPASTATSILFSAGSR